jgi:hypothetical protein
MQGRDFASSEDDSEDDAPRRRAGGRGARGAPAAGRGAGRGAGARSGSRAPGAGPSGLHLMSRPGSASDDAGAGEFDASGAGGPGLLGIPQLGTMLGGPGAPGMLSPRLFQALGEPGADAPQALPGGGEGGVPLPCIEGSWGIPLLLPDGAQLVPLQPSLLGPLGAGGAGLMPGVPLLPGGGEPGVPHGAEGGLPMALPLVGPDGAPAPAGLPLFDLGGAPGAADGSVAGAQRPVCEPPLAVLPLALGGAPAGARCVVGGARWAPRRGFLSNRPGGRDGSASNRFGARQLTNQTPSLAGTLPPGLPTPPRPSPWAPPPRSSRAAARRCPAGPTPATPRAAPPARGACRACSCASAATPPCSWRTPPAWASAWTSCCAAAPTSCSCRCGTGCRPNYPSILNNQSARAPFKPSTTIPPYSSHRTAPTTSPPPQTYGSFDIDVLRTSLTNMRSADLNEMILSGELAALTAGLPDPAGGAAGAAAGAPAAGQPARQQGGGGDAGAAAAAAAAAARADRKRMASPTGLPRSPLGALMAPPLGLDLGAIGDGAKRARRSGGCFRASEGPSQRAAANPRRQGSQVLAQAVVRCTQPPTAPPTPIPPSPPGRVSALLMELDAPSVRGAFAAAHGRISSSGFDLFDLGPGFPLGALHGGLGGALELASPTSQHPQQQHAPRPAAPGGGGAPRPAGASLPAALQPAPEELMRFGGAGMQLPAAPPLQTGGPAAALAASPAKGMLPPMHVIEGLL